MLKKKIQLPRAAGLTEKTQSSPLEPSKFSEGEALMTDLAEVVTDPQHPESTRPTEPYTAHKSETIDKPEGEDLATTLFRKIQDRATPARTASSTFVALIAHLKAIASVIPNAIDKAEFIFYSACVESNWDLNFKYCVKDGSEALQSALTIAKRYPACLERMMK